MEQEYCLSKNLTPTLRPSVQCNGLIGLAHNTGNGRLILHQIEEEVSHYCVLLLEMTQFRLERRSSQLSGYHIVESRLGNTYSGKIVSDGHHRSGDGEQAAMRDSIFRLLLPTHRGSSDHFQYDRPQSHCASLDTLPSIMETGHRLTVRSMQTVHLFMGRPTCPQSKGQLRLRTERCPGDKSGFRDHLLGDVYGSYSRKSLGREHWNAGFRTMQMGGTSRVAAPTLGGEYHFV